MGADAVPSTCCDLVLPESRLWDFPLSRAEMVQRLLHMFEVEIDNREHEAECLRQENQVLRAAAARGQAAAPAPGAPVVEATLDLCGAAGPCIVRGGPEQLAALLSSLSGGAICASATPPVADGHKWRNHSERSSSAPANSCQTSGTSSMHSGSRESSPNCSPRGSSCGGAAAMLSRAGASSCGSQGSRDSGPEKPCNGRPALPSLSLGRLSEVASTCGHELPVSSPSAAAPGSTPRVFSLRKLPTATPRQPRVVSLATPDAVAPLASARTPHVGGAAATPRGAVTPRAAARVWSLVTPRAPLLRPTPERVHFRPPIAHWEVAMPTAADANENAVNASTDHAQPTFPSKDVCELRLEFPCAASPVAIAGEPRDSAIALERPPEVVAAAWEAMSEERRAMVSAALSASCPSSREVQAPAPEEDGTANEDACDTEADDAAATAAFWGSSASFTWSGGKATLVKVSRMGADEARRVPERVALLRGKAAGVAGVAAELARQGLAQAAPAANDSETACLSHASFLGGGLGWRQRLRVKTRKAASSPPPPPPPPPPILLRRVVESA
mmetsp:Transcript_935/g.2314  ORF Transcript_935/g.2314 Transcript_935/m.2314 type:complete len:560 (+) Transcript_935:89-1768(+)